MTREPGRPIEQRQQATDQGERPDDQRREGRLDPVRADRPLREDRAGVVDEDVEARLGRQHLRRRRRGPTRASPCPPRRPESDRRRGGRRAHRGRPSAAPRSRPTSTTRAPSAASSSVDLATEPGRRPGDEHRPAGQGVRRAAASTRTAGAGPPGPIREKLPTTVSSSRSSMQCPRVDAVPAWLQSALSSVCLMSDATLGVMSQSCQAFGRDMLDKPCTRSSRQPRGRD